MFKRIVFLGVVVLVAVAAYWLLTREDARPFEEPDVPEVSYTEVIEGVEGVEVIEGTEGIEEEEVIEGVEGVEGVEEETVEQEGEGLVDIPEEFNLAVAFTSQAPHSNWELPYQEACEEASTYMVSLYYGGEPSGKVDPAVADAAILELVQFQNDMYGDYLDTTAQETLQFMMEFYNVGGELVYNPTVEQIKNEIAHGRPVIVPAAGRELGNPNFTGLGPLYHMFVIKGYTADKFITNDPGTRNGENYVYDIDVVMDAIGDWNDGDPANGDKVVIFTHR